MARVIEISPIVEEGIPLKLYIQNSLYIYLGVF